MRVDLHQVRFTTAPVGELPSSVTIGPVMQINEPGCLCVQTFRPMATWSRELAPLPPDDPSLRPDDASRHGLRTGQNLRPLSRSGLVRRAFIAGGARTALLGTSALVLTMAQISLAKPEDPRPEIALNEPDQEGRLTLETTLAKRRSVRDFSPGPLTLAEISQLLWAGQGITSREGFRTAPSAGALYPLDLYVVAGQVQGLPIGVFRYQPTKRVLESVAADDRRRQLSKAALSQTWIRDSAAVLAIAATARRTTWKYGERGLRYIYMEAGHVAQNICLQAVSLGLATTPVGAFRDDEVRRVLELRPDAEPVYLLPIGRP